MVVGTIWVDWTPGECFVRVFNLLLYGLWLVLNRAEVRLMFWLHYGWRASNGNILKGYNLIQISNLTRLYFNRLIIFDILSLFILVLMIITHLLIIFLSSLNKCDKFKQLGLFTIVPIRNFLIVWFHTLSHMSYKVELFCSVLL